MAAIWEPENRYRIWLDIECHACDARAGLGNGAICLKNHLFKIVPFV